VKKAPKHLAELHSTYVEVQSVAKKQHLNLWRYGDITEDDDKEFGMNNETVKAKWNNISLDIFDIAIILILYTLLLLLIGRYHILDKQFILVFS